MERLFTQLMDAFSIEYMFSVIMAAYFIIKGIDYFNGDSPVPTWVKRVMTCLVGLIAFWIFRLFTDEQFETLTASFFAAIFFYDITIKGLLKKFNIDYRKE